MISKNTPRKLDKSTDYRLIAPTSMVDALNAYVYSSSDSSSDQGDSGVLKNVKGTTLVSSSGVTDDVYRVLGSVVDTKIKLVYLFVWSSDANNQGVYVYDPEGKLPTSVSSGPSNVKAIKPVFTSPKFKFPKDGYVSGSIVYGTTNSFRTSDSYSSFSESFKRDFEKSSILFFTDNKNEPRKIDVLRSITSNYSHDTDIDEEDFITACPRVPMHPVRCVFKNESQLPSDFQVTPTDRTSYFQGVPGFQFAYQLIYNDGSESAVAPYSDICFPPSIVQQGTNPSPNFNQDNVCQIDFAEVHAKDNSDYVNRVRLLARKGNTGAFFVCDEFNFRTDKGKYYNNDLKKYYFRNDKVGRGISAEEVAKQFDNVPRKAEAQTVHSNRLMYANYLDGFDNVETSCTYTVLFSEKADENISNNLDIKSGLYEGRTPSEWNINVARVDEASGKTDDSTLVTGFSSIRGAVNKSSGIRIDTSGLPNYLPTGTVIDVGIRIAPDRNFHLYEARGSYHGSRHLSHRSGHKGSIDPDTLDVLPGSELEDHDKHFQSKIEAGDRFLTNNSGSYPNVVSVGAIDTRGDHRFSFAKGACGPSYFGRNAGIGQSHQAGDGVNDNYVYWKDLSTFLDPNAETELTNIYDSADPYPVRKAFYGTSAANPFIIRGEALNFRVNLTVKKNIDDDARRLIGQAIYYALVKGHEDESSTGFNDSSSEVFQYFVDNTTPSDVVGKIDYSLGLDDRDIIDPGSEHSYLVCGLKCSRPDETLQGDNFGDFAKTYTPPDGYFILNSFKADMFFEPTNQGNAFSTEFNENEDFPILKLGMGTVHQAEAFTCVKPIINPNGPWRVFKPETIDTLETGNTIDNIANFGQGPITKTSPTGEMNINDYRINLYSGTDFQAFNDQTDDSEAAVLPFFVKYNGSVWGEYNGILGDDREKFIGPAMPFGYLCDVNGSPIGDSADIANICRGKTNARSSISIADGESGPGGISLGNPTPRYKERGNDTFGSVAARVDFFGNEAQMFDSEIGSTWSLIDYAEDSDVQSVTEITAANSAIANHFGIGAAYGRTYSFNLPSQLGNGGTDSMTGGWSVYPRVKNSVFTSLGVSTDPQDIDANGVNRSEFCANLYFSGPFFTGDIRMNPCPGAFGNVAQQANRYDVTTVLPNLWYQFDASSSSEEPYVQSQVPFDFPEAFDQTQGRFPYPNLSNQNKFIDGANSLDFRDESPNIETFTPSFNITKPSSQLDGDEFRSFKTNANHDFGVVYYDSRGRHGFVNHLVSAYVPGYSDVERGAAKGKASIRLEFGHNPPDWAHYYKIVYSKNTSVERFIQYSAGGAYVKTSDIDDENSQNIYVSLNYLQHHPISYVSSFGARPSEGGLDLYKFSPGDKLRILSYETSEDVRQYPFSYDFEVVDYVLLDVDQNPIAPNDGPDSVPDERHKGAFVVLRDNASANGFTHSDIKNGFDKWGNNAIFEIYSPSKEREEDSLVYYEVGPTYKVVKIEDGVRHAESSILLDAGDVFYRPVPINVRPVEDPDDGQFSNANNYRDLIVNTKNQQNVNGSLPRFRQFYLETEAANDKFRSKADFQGRPNFILPDAVETVRESSITYSDPSNPASKKLNYGSFNPSLANFKDLPENFGDIHYMVSFDDGVFVIQTDKCISVPVGRNIVEYSDGSNQITSSRNVLGTEYIYEGRAGCDFNPESVVVQDGTVFFTHKSLGRVFMYSKSSGVEDISGINMGAFFRKVFTDAIASSEEPNANDVRIVGGYDPIKKEYLVTIVDPGQLAEEATNEEDVVQPDLIVGCTDPNATNYDPEATQDDGSCTYSGGGDGGANNALFSVTMPVLPSQIQSQLTIGEVVNGTPLIQQLTVTPTGGTQEQVDVYQGNYYSYPLEFTVTVPDDIRPDGQILIKGNIQNGAISDNIGWRFTENQTNESVFVSIFNDNASFEISFNGFTPPGTYTQYVDISVPIDSSGSVNQNAFAGLSNGFSGGVSIELIDVLNQQNPSQVCIEAANLTNAEANVTFSVAGDIESLNRGCTDTRAINYNSTANEHTDTCVYAGCTDPLACNLSDFLDPTFIEAEGGYYTGYSGNDPVTFNSIPADPVVQDDGSCDLESCYGCTDAAASNYDVDATVDDGSCLYYGCTIPDSSLCSISALVGGDNDSDVTYFDLVSFANNELNLNSYLPDDAIGVATVYTQTSWGFALGCAQSFAELMDQYVYGQYLGVTSAFAYSVLTFLNGEPYDGDLSNPPSGAEFGTIPWFTYSIPGNPCVSTEIPGCTDPNANNYNASANLATGCVYNVSYCGDSTACNYDADPESNISPVGENPEINVTDTPALCAYAFEYLSGDSAFDTAYAFYNGDSASFNEAYGCDGQCLGGISAGCDGICGSGSVNDQCGICGGDGKSCEGCTDSGACNYDSTATVDDGSCEYSSCAGCTDPTACNYDATATIDNGSCTFSADNNGVNGLDCNGQCFRSSYDGFYGDSFNFICGCTGGTLPPPFDQEYGCLLCTDDTACNYSEYANVSGVQSADAYCENNAGFCNTNSIQKCEYSTCQGCTDMGANNYDPDATNDDGSCTYDETGCTDSTACNWNDTAVEDDGSCVYIQAPECDCFGNVPDCNGECGGTAVLDDCGVCGGDNSSCSGCTEPGYIEYDPNATIDDGSCETEIIYGCTDSAACNYKPDANVDDGSCVIPNGPCQECDGNTVVDVVSEDCNNIPGCTDPVACNYDSTADIDDGSCEYLSCKGCTDPAADNYNANATEDDGSCEYSGCTDETALNYDPDATQDDGSCFYQNWNPETACNSCKANYDEEITIEINGQTETLRPINPTNANEPLDQNCVMGIWKNGAFTQANVFLFDYTGTQIEEPDFYVAYTLYSQMVLQEWQTCDITYPIPCPGDLDGNGGIDSGDLLDLLASFNSSIADGTTYNVSADLNLDGSVSTADLLEFLGVFGQTCASGLPAPKMTEAQAKEVFDIIENNPRTKGLITLDQVKEKLIYSRETSPTGFTTDFSNRGNTLY